MPNHGKIGLRERAKYILFAQRARPFAQVVRRLRTVRGDCDVPAGGCQGGITAKQLLDNEEWILLRRPPKLS